MVFWTATPPSAKTGRAACSQDELVLAARWAGDFANNFVGDDTTPSGSLPATARRRRVLSVSAMDSIDALANTIRGPVGRNERSAELPTEELAHNQEALPPPPRKAHRESTWRINPSVPAVRQPVARSAVYEPTDAMHITAFRGVAPQDAENGSAILLQVPRGSGPGGWVVGSAGSWTEGRCRRFRRRASHATARWARVALVTITSTDRVACVLSGIRRLQTTRRRRDRERQWPASIKPRTFVPRCIRSGRSRG